MIEVISAFAVWRLTSLFFAEQGPFNFFADLREVLKTTKLFDCFWCLSLWVSFPFALFTDHFIIYWLGYSGIAILIDQAIEKLDI